MIGIYKVTSPNNRVYIGQSIYVEKRFKEYLNLRNCKLQHKLYNSFIKYGAENHIFEVIEECSIELLNERERYWQDFYNVLNGGLNCKTTSTSTKTGFQSEETKLKMSLSHKGKRLGVKMSDEQKLKLSIAKKGKTPPNKGINTFYKYVCYLCNKEFLSRSKKAKLCSIECRNLNNKICNERRKITKVKKETKSRKNIRIKEQLHGTVREYVYYKCRCVLCVENIKIYYKEKRNNILFCIN